MRRLISLSLLPILAACSVEARNGSQVQWNSPLLFGQNWDVTQRVAAHDGSRSCALASGELQVELTYDGKREILAVGTGNSLNPGDRYRVIMGNNVYETKDQWFDAKQSQAIIADMMKYDTVYTETVIMIISKGGGNDRRLGNKIPLAQFAPHYKQCEAYVHS